MLTCNKCSRANPDQAVYCYFDGVALGRAAGAGGGVAAPAAPISLQQFSQPFTFPGGLICRNFDQLALGCQENWSAALELLKQGHLEKFLSSQGRADLAMAAREAARFPDKDRGLDQFLARLPSQAVKAPQLRVDQTVISLGAVRVGEDRKLELNLENQGMRLLYGSIIVKDAPWLSVGAKPGAQQKLFQFGSDLTIPINVIGKRLRASNKSLEGQLILESNGGNFVVTVKADVAIKPYPDGVLAGARSPRQIAEKAKGNAKEAAPLFEKGAVAQWYKDNGWIYPVRGPSASGLGAVQQYFEALGLTPPPKVGVSDKSISLQAEPGANVQHVLEVKSEEKRPVYAHATSDQPWLEIGRARLNGRVASIPLRVSNVPARSGETLHAKLTVTSNGNQRFVIPVTLRIGQGLSEFAAVAPVGRGALIAAPRRAKPFNKAHLLPAALLALCCLLVIAWDLFRNDEEPMFAGDTVGKTGDTKIISDGPKGPLAKSNELLLGITFTPTTSRFGFVANKLNDPRNPSERKKLTRDLNGQSSNVCFKIDGYEYIYGHETSNNRWGRDKGKLLKEAPLAGVPTDRGWRSVMTTELHQITITQDVQIVVGENTLMYDTALVTYLVKNESKSNRRTVGLRVMLDTFVGLNDGVPIFIPEHGEPAKPAFLLTTMQEFPQKDIPDYIMAVESGDLKDQNSTVAVMGLRLRNIEVPEKMVICAWPSEHGSNEARWKWPYSPMDKNPAAKDSCVVLYWTEANMNPGETRRLGYTYGLGRIAGLSGGDETIAERGGGQMRLFTSISKLNKPFTATAYIKTNQQGEKVTMELPAGMSFAPGQAATQVIPPPSSAGYSAVSWRVIASEAKEYELRATVESIGTATAKVRVSAGGLFN